MYSLVICIGNKARGDDGAGRRVAELLAGRLPSGVRLLEAPALDVTMAEDVAGASQVVFADAERREAPPVRVDELAAAPGDAGPHGIAPSALLALAEALYGRAPAARFVTLAAPDMAHAEGLSPTAASAAESGAAEVLRLLGA